ITVFSTIGFSVTTIDLDQEWKKLIRKYAFEEEKQSYCFEENGQVRGTNIHSRVKPASVTKLYTSLWALDTLGKDFRFLTKFILSGKDLYIEGGEDPFFVTENLFAIIAILNENGIYQLE